MSSRSLLHHYGYLNDDRMHDDVSMVVYILDRIIVADLKMTRDERITFLKIASDLADVLGCPAKAFAEMLRHHGSLQEEQEIGDGLLLRMTRDALGYLEQHLTSDQRRTVFEKALELALSDELLHKRELMVLFELAAISTGRAEELQTTFRQLHEATRRRLPADHPVVTTLEEFLGIVSLPWPEARLKLIQRPDDPSDTPIPPLVFTYAEWADWICHVSVVRAGQHRKAPMNHTRITYTMGNMTVQKGLIKWMALTGPEDEQLDEARDFCHQWCEAVQKGIGNVPFPDDQIFSAIVFGSDGDSFSDCCLPSRHRPGQWHITCRKQKETIEVHAFDISGDDPSTYWCPEMSDRLSARTGLRADMTDGRYPADPAARTLLLDEAREKFR